MEENPYGAPQVALVDEQRGLKLPGWSVAQLELLGWLSLVSVIGTLVLLIMAFIGGMTAQAGLERYSDWLGLVLVLLGDYLLLRLNSFAQARFDARGLTAPVWTVVVLSLLMEAFDLAFGNQSFTHFSWDTLVYFGFLFAFGASSAWYGIRLLKVQNVYPVFRLMAWLEIVGGLMMATLVLMLLGMLPLLGATLAMMVVFFKGAAEVRAQAS
ncbi:hypothetical protein [Pseudomonas sp.]|uniref:hypothetical protein n=1 Tax=Pseudomonas sp. TaxID=306 RepID=UPI0028AB6AC5|nr:hypothetical protein [Pseudomonas sp.]